MEVLASAGRVRHATGMTDAVDDVLRLHDRHHERLSELLYGVLDRLVDVDVAGARATFAAFERELDEGLALEDELVMPVYRTLQPQQGPGRADHVDGDHVILRRGIGFVQVLLDEVAASPVRRTALVGLPHVYRLLGTLEHHTERERRHVYPVAVPALADDARARLRAALGHLVDVVAVP
jgi:hypothetical protein